MGEKKAERNAAEAGKAAHTLQSYSKQERNLYLLGLSGQNILYGISSVLGYYYQFTLLLPAMTVGLLLTVNQI